MSNDANMNVTMRNGITTCTNNNGVEIIYKIPRNKLAACADINELNHGGIYFLFGEHNNRSFIYVGHSVCGLFKKICEHDRDTDKNFFTEAIVFTTANNSFGARELIWLEDKFFDALKKTGRLVVKIGNDEQSDNFDAHAEFATTALDIIGYKIFEPLPKVDEPDEEIFYLKRYVKRIGRTINAKMKRTSTGYRVLAGSEISPLEDGKRPLNVKNARSSAKLDTNGKLLEDVEFLKSSPAAEFVLGNNANGLTEWRTQDGTTLNEFLGR